MDDITETIEETVETAEENLTAVDAVITVAVSALVGAVAVVGIPKLYRRIRRPKHVTLELIDCTSTEV